MSICKERERWGIGEGERERERERGTEREGANRKTQPHTHILRIDISEQFSRTTVNVS